MRTISPNRFKEVRLTKTLTLKITPEISELICPQCDVLIGLTFPIKGDNWLNSDQTKPPVSNFDYCKTDTGTRADNQTSLPRKKV
jgi:hypothetical protein